MQSTAYISNQNCFCFSVLNDAKIQCVVGGQKGTGSIREFKLQALDCPDGITQCMKAGPKLGGEFSCH